MKIIIKYLKKIVLGGVILFTYNLIASSFNITIPINFFTIFIVGLFDIPGLGALVVLKKFII